MSGKALVRVNLANNTVVLVGIYLGASGKLLIICFEIQAIIETDSERRRTKGFPTHLSGIWGF